MHIYVYRSFNQGRGDIVGGQIGDELYARELGAHGGILFVYYVRAYFYHIIIQERFEIC